MKITFDTKNISKIRGGNSRWVHIVLPILEKEFTFWLFSSIFNGGIRKYGPYRYGGVQLVSYLKGRTNCAKQISEGKEAFAILWDGAGLYNNFILQTPNGWNSLLSTLFLKNNHRGVFKNSVNFLLTQIYVHLHPHRRIGVGINSTKRPFVVLKQV